MRRDGRRRRLDEMKGEGGWEVEEAFLLIEVGK